MRKQRDRLYWVWAEMLSRCRNHKHKQFADYGARGIAVCEAWLSFEAFRADMSPRPLGMMLERKDNNAGYSPDNCCWATRQQQNSNRRNCIFVECDGEQVTLKEACRRKGLAYRAVLKRIQDRNWPVDLALSAPLGTGKQFYRIPARSA